MSERAKAIRVLVASTVAFAVCFAAWMLNGVLVTFLADNRVIALDKSQIGWLMGVPVLTGAVMRLPVGVLSDRFGGRAVFTALLLASAVPTYLLSYASTFSEMLLASFGFGLTGASFAVGVAYTAAFFPKNRQGTALGVFGMGNIGAAVTSMAAPSLLRWLTDGGARADAWRTMPRIYAAALVVTAVLFVLVAVPHRVEGGGKSLADRLAPLRRPAVWRFAFFYFLTFGGFVALSQWLIPYYVAAYAMTLPLAGLMAAAFSLPSGLVRAVGGWLSDRLGAEPVLRAVFAACVVACALLVVPRMDIESPGEGVLAAAPGRVTEVRPDRIQIGETAYPIAARDPARAAAEEPGILLFPKGELWQEPIVKVGDTVARKQLLARGVTRIHFQANVWIFSGLVLVVGAAMGIGMAAVYKLIPEHFPADVGVVGGIVGVVGGLGGFVCPIVFGYLLRFTGIWTTCWMLFAAISAACLVWLHAAAGRAEPGRAALDLPEGLVEEASRP